MNDRESSAEAGAASGPVLADSVSYEATSEVVRDSLAVEVTATNTATAPRHIEFGACPLSLSLEREPGAAGPADWDEERLDRVCVLYLATRDLAPGESIRPKEFRHAVAVGEIMGDSLEAGRYAVTARLAVDGRLHVLDAGEVELAASR